MKLGSLCSGYGGLDLACASYFDAEHAWVSEVDSAACGVLERRFPGVPNLGDLTGSVPTLFASAAWEYVEPVDVLAAGYPCQPFSLAGRRQGTNDDRHIWPHIAAAIRVLRPAFVVLENVAGHLRLGFDVVLGDLAALGYSARWGCIRASDAGAPHRRERLFVLAEDASDARGVRRSSRPRLRADDPHRLRRRRPRHVRSPAYDWPDAECWCCGGTVAWDGECGDCGHSAWADHEPAIRRWEQLTGSECPPPHRDGVLAPEFVEWLMGLEPGWVTDVIADRGDALRLLGNGVVPQQAELALDLIAELEAAA